jgi:hypothetical protein
VIPVPEVGLPVASSGGHAAAQAPLQALFVPTSALNKYKVRPCALTRICPRLLFETPTAAEAPLGVLGAAAVAAPPPPHAAMDSAATGTTAALSRKVTGLRCVISLLRVGGLTLAPIEADRIM